MRLTKGFEFRYFHPQSYRWGLALHLGIVLIIVAIVLILITLNFPLILGKILDALIWIFLK